MPLTWDVSNIEDYENVCFERRKPDPSEGKVDSEHLNEDGEARYLRPLTEVLIFSTMSVGLRGITADNVGKFAARLDLLQKHDGAYLTHVDEDGKRSDQTITAEDVIAHIGLSCNVSDETDAAWIKRTITEDYKRQAKRIQREADEQRKVEA